VRIVAVLVPCTLLAACVVPGYTLPDGKPQAELKFEVSTDSAGATLATPSYLVRTFGDPNCSEPTEGTRLLTIKSTGPKDVGGPIKVVGGEPLTLGVTTLEARLAQNRQCSFTTTFTPAAGQSYTVQFVSRDQARACGLRVLDADGKQVAHKDPVNSCATTFAGQLKNGGGGMLIW
jgi:hypothetical protein